MEPVGAGEELTMSAESDTIGLRESSSKKRKADEMQDAIMEDANPTESMAIDDPKSQPQPLTGNERIGCLVVDHRMAVFGYIRGYDRKIYTVYKFEDEKIDNAADKKRKILELAKEYFVFNRKTSKVSIQIIDRLVVLVDSSIFDEMGLDASDILDPSLQELILSIDRANIGPCEDIFDEAVLQCSLLQKFPFVSQGNLLQLFNRGLMNGTSVSNGLLLFKALIAGRCRNFFILRENLRAITHLCPFFGLLVPLDGVHVINGSEQKLNFRRQGGVGALLIQGTTRQSLEQYKFEDVPVPTLAERLQSELPIYDHAKYLWSLHEDHLRSLMLIDRSNEDTWLCGDEDNEAYRAYKFAYEPLCRSLYRLVDILERTGLGVEDVLSFPRNQM